MFDMPKNRLNFNGTCGAQSLVQFLDAHTQLLGIHLPTAAFRSTPPLQVFLPIRSLLSFVLHINLFQQLLNLRSQALLVDLLAFRPHHFVLVGVRFDLRPIYEIRLQANLARLDQILQHLAKHFVDHALHPAAAEVVDRAKVRAVPPAQPHEMNVLPQRFGYLARQVDLLGIGIDQLLQQHLRVVARGASPLVLCQQGAQVKLVDRSAHHPHQVPWLDEIVVTGW